MKAKVYPRHENGIMPYGVLVTIRQVKLWITPRTIGRAIRSLPFRLCCRLMDLSRSDTWGRFTERLARLLTDADGAPSDFTETVVIGSIIMVAALWLTWAVAHTVGL